MTANAPANWRASTLANGTPGLPPVAPPALGDVVLDEVMADNLTAVTNAGALPDWVEIHLYNTDPLNADTDGDGVSDSIELLFPPSQGCPGDLNNDSSVTIADLLVLLSSIGQVC